MKLRHFGQIILIGIIFLQGCEKSFTYHYISLDGTGDVSVLEYGRSNLNNLENHNEMPIKYLLARDHYSLIFTVDRDSFWPAMLIEIKSESGYTISGSATSPCGRIRQIEDSPASLRYMWAPKLQRGCDNKEAMTKTSQFVIDVLDSDGRLVEQERVEYVLMKNGTYIQLDAP